MDFTRPASTSSVSSVDMTEFLERRLVNELAQIRAHSAEIVSLIRRRVEKARLTDSATFSERYICRVNSIRRECQDETYAVMQRAVIEVELLDDLMASFKVARGQLQDVWNDFEDDLYKALKMRELWRQSAGAGATTASQSTCYSQESLLIDLDSIISFPGYDSATPPESPSPSPPSSPNVRASFLDIDDDIIPSTRPNRMPVWLNRTPSTQQRQHLSKGIPFEPVFAQVARSADVKAPKKKKSFWKKVIGSNASSGSSESRDKSDPVRPPTYWGPM